METFEEVQQSKENFEMKKFEDFGESVGEKQDEVQNFEDFEIDEDKAIKGDFEEGGGKDNFEEFEEIKHNSKENFENEKQFNNFDDFEIEEEND